ncbi:MAG TPA: septum site-determining protein MinC [Kofleriaceae bacterium]|nr:septum site-determining protein MinC [Kofleriaceae bacterium]
MSQAPLAVAAVSEDDVVGASATTPGKAEHVSLRGTTRGLEILISGTPSTAALGAQLAELLAEAPTFFAGSTARVAFEGALPVGALACLEEVATRFELTLVEIAPVARRSRSYAAVIRRPQPAAQSKLAEGTGPIAEAACEPRGRDGAASAELPALPGEPTCVPDPPDPIDIAFANTRPYSAEALAAELSSAGRAAGLERPEHAPSDAAAESPVRELSAAEAAGIEAALASAMPAMAEPMAAKLAEELAAKMVTRMTAELAAQAPSGPRLVIGPVRSGVIVDHTGHVIVIGDVNPGAEVRAEGSIIVLGRLRGVAHAAIGREAGCIIALSLQPQQLRIGRMVARAADADRPSGGAEIAYATGETIVVERFGGRLPSGLAASM